MKIFETKKDLKEQRDDAEARAVTHFRKLNKIENILKESDRTKEPYVDTVIKIKELVYNHHNEN